MARALLLLTLLGLFLLIGGLFVRTGPVEPPPSAEMGVSEGLASPTVYAETLRSAAAVASAPEATTLALSTADGTNAAPQRSIVGITLFLLFTDHSTLGANGPIAYSALRTILAL